MSTEEKGKKRPSSGIANANPWTYFTFAWIQPIIYIIRFFQETDASLLQGYLFALGLSIVGIFHVTLHHHTFWPSMRTGMRIRAGLIGIQIGFTPSLTIVFTIPS
ncbi:hypothetical protein BC937DRAFT_86636 [Endogone sp. FLAS-F59071]|nr:hypothetical protein BC937DRAFT_86636 [Endogone sp. FLAS-F59071]|eukprot:RUS12943.1 hypothetical protein BC937DRAFT_86636 [Endogone sp. FLAS-F59071]